MKDILSHPQNKRVLTEIFAKAFIEVMGLAAYVVAFGFTIETNIPGWDVFEHCHYEADTLLICCINKLVTMTSDMNSMIESSCKFEIISPDTDVLILAINFLQQSRADMNINFKMTTSSKMTNEGPSVISVNYIVSNIGKIRSGALLGTFILTGCDHIGCFNGITKERCFKTVRNMDCSKDSDLLDTLVSFGSTLSLSGTEMGTLTKFVMKLYLSKRKGDAMRYSEVDDIGRLRWQMFSKRQTETESLPPTPGALEHHLRRSNYVSFMLKKLSTEFMPSIPAPATIANQDHGWELVDEKPKAIMTRELPAPEFALELTTCGCKGGCRNKQCKCVKYDLKCSDACNCINCENEDSRFQSITD